MEEWSGTIQPIIGYPESFILNTRQSKVTDDIDQKRTIVYRYCGERKRTKIPSPNGRGGAAIAAGVRSKAIISRPKGRNRYAPQSGAINLTGQNISFAGETPAFPSRRYHQNDIGGSA